MGHAFSVIGRPSTAGRGEGRNLWRGRDFSAKKKKHRELMANDYSEVKKVINAFTKKRGGGGITIPQVKNDTSHDTLC